VSAGSGISVSPFKKKLNNRRDLPPYLSALWMLRIAYRDEDHAPQVAIFEVPKKMPRTLLAVLQQRAPQGCKPAAYERCRVAQM
jgi:hypothetical protein